MKNALFATLAAVLLTATSAFAAPDGPRITKGPGDRDFNYGYAKNHRVTDRERARWEAQHRNDRDDRRADDRFDRNQNYGFERTHKVTRDERRHWEEAHNYGYAQNHRVTPQERARWESSYRR
jgi:hypothetical protein